MINDDDPRDSVDHYTDIIDEIFDLVSVGAPHGIDRLTDRLQFIIDNHEYYTTGELTCWLRGTYTWSDRLTNWNNLLTVAKEQAINREEENVSKIFLGLI